MMTRLMVSLAFVAFFSVPVALAGGDCPFRGHKTTAQSADAQTTTPQSTASENAAALPQTVVPEGLTVTVAEAPTEQTAQD